MPDIDYWLGRKYAILGQQADADTSRAATDALTGAAQANLQGVQAKLLPSESAAQVALQRAQGRVASVTADLMPAESRAKISLMGSEAGLNSAQSRVAGANVGLIGTQNEVLKRDLITYSGGDAQGVANRRTYGADWLPSIVPPRR